MYVFWDLALQYLFLDKNKFKSKYLSTVYNNLKNLKISIYSPQLENGVATIDKNNVSTLIP